MKFETLPHSLQEQILAVMDSVIELFELLGIDEDDQEDEKLNEFILRQYEGRTNGQKYDG